MKIAGTNYDVKHKALEVYVSGCRPPHCKGCHNSSLWKFSEGTPYKKYEWNIPDMVEKIWVMGGEPQDQKDEEMIDMLKMFKEKNLEVWIWTRYNNLAQCLVPYTDYVKMGRYLENVEGYQDKKHKIYLASGNQRIEKV